MATIDKLTQYISPIGTTSAVAPPSNPRLLLPQPTNKPAVPDKPRLLPPLRSTPHLLYLFSKSDIPTFIVPVTAFGLLCSLSGSPLTLDPSPDSALTIFLRIPAVVAFVWLNVLIFEFANQRDPASVLEDSCNKPWRPIPSGRISEAGTRRLLLAAIPAVLTASFAAGVWRETVLLVALGWMYNDLGGGDEDFVVRNVILAAAFGVYHEGAARLAVVGVVPDPALREWWVMVMMGGGRERMGDDRPAVSELPPAMFAWTAIVSAVICTTIHVQDLRDQVGDAAKGRRSAPLVLGDGVARWTMTLPIVFWSIVCPMYWDVSIVWWVVPVTMGFVLAVRLILLRTPEQDHTCYVLWAVWLCCLYLLPVVKNPGTILKLVSS